MRLYQDPDTGYWTVMDGGVLTNVHDPKLCADRGCAIHNHPSTHPLMDAPLNWRTDRGILERVCEHGVGHDDHDAVLYQKSISEDKYIGTHGCCGCCWGGSC